ncbi:MAG: ATP-dependent endonuclease [Candidatus Thorarchaeota archaeon]
MFIRNIKINNFRCFKPTSPTINFRTPDGTNPGSGLNILVGENATGKTTLLEAINYLTESAFAVQNKLSVFDFHDNSNEIIIFSDTDKFTYKMPDIYRDQSFDCNGISFKATLRQNKSPGKFFSTPIQASWSVNNVDKYYKNKVGKQGNKKIDEYHKLFDTDRLAKDEEFNIFYFDKFRTRHIIKRETYKTTFQKIIDDLNWKFHKSIRDNDSKKIILEGLVEEYFPKILEEAEKGISSKLSKATKEFFDQEKLQHIKIDFINIWWPFSDGFFALREDSSLNQIPVNKLGSGVEMIFTILLLRSIYEKEKGSIIYLIDEPELSLHPQAQNRLFDLLVEESKNKQVILSTHSPFFTSPNYIESIIKFSEHDTDGITTYRLENATLANKVKENRNFFFRHRALFFAKRAIFIEGVDDYERYQKYLDAKGIENLYEHFYIMGGADHTIFYEAICRALGIMSCAIVDKDFAVQRSKWARGNRQRFISDIKKFIKDNGIDFNLEDFEKAMEKELIEKPRKGEREVQEIEVNGTKLWKVKDTNIFVLQQGEVKDYLTKNGVLVTELKEQKERELYTIFRKIKDILQI